MWVSIASVTLIIRSRSSFIIYLFPTLRLQPTLLFAFPSTFENVTCQTERSQPSNRSS
jgi:hypothetical protein